MRLLALLGGGLLALTAVATAFGHAEPERFDPAPGSVLSQAPARIDGWFIQEIRRADESFIEVYDEAGKLVSTSTTVDDTDRRHMFAELQPGLGAGRYMVAYQTYSDEDEEVSGACFLFFVGQEAADAAHEDKLLLDAAGDCPVKPEEEATVTPTPAASAKASDGGGVSTGAAIAIAAAAALVGLLAGGGIGYTIRRR